MSNSPYFSVITPSWNQGRYLSSCIDSIKNQKDSDYEHIIVDNCSTDETGAILADYAKEHQVKVIIEVDRGQSEAVNKGLRLAQGEIICWLNSDDAYLPETFELLRETFSDPSVDVVFGDVRQISYDGRFPERLVAGWENRNDLVRWWNRKVKLHQPAIFFRRSVMEKVGFLREDLHYAMDYEYWWRISEHYPFHYLGKELAIQHRQPESKTIKAWHRVLEEREQIFSSFYGLLDTKESVLRKERSQALAEQYLLLAYAAVRNDRSAAWFYLKEAFLQSPRVVLRPSS